MKPSELAQKRVVNWRNPTPTSPAESGLTIRHIAALFALQGLMADPESHADELMEGETCSQGTARLAVEQGDNLIRALCEIPFKDEPNA